MSKEKKIVFSTKMVDKITKMIEDGFVLPRTENPYYDGILGLRKDGISFKMTNEEIEDYIKCKIDIQHFANNYCKVKSEDGSYKIIKLRDYQKEILDMYDKNQYSVLMASRQIGKTITTAIFILHYMLFNNEKNILIAANKFETSVEIMDKIREIYIGLPFFLKQGIKVWNQRVVKFSNKCRLKSLTMTKSSSIGNAADMVFADEFAYINDNIADSFYKSIIPTMASIENSKMVITSTPNGINLFHKILTGAERPIGDPLKNKFAAMRVYWHQVPGRNTTFIRLDPYKMQKYGVDKDYIYNRAKELFNPNDLTDSNDFPIVQLKSDPNNGFPIVNVINVDITKEDILKMTFITSDNEELPISMIADVSTWKEDAIKDIGSLEAFNQEYDLRFINSSKSILTEATIERLEQNKKEFEHIPHDVFMSKLKWDYSNLLWRTDIDIEANRKKIKGVISVDVSEGLGLDYSVINIFQIQPKPIDYIQKNHKDYTNLSDFFQLAQIGIFRSNIVSVMQLAELLYLLGFEYFDEDNFKIVLEINNHGLAVLSNMRYVFEDKNNYGSHIFFKFKHRKDATEKKIGLKVSGNKKLMVKDYQDCMESRAIEVYQADNIREISTFIKNVTNAGNVKYEADGSSNDDTTMTIVNMSQVFDDNIFKDMIEEVMKEYENTEVGKLINEYLSKIDTIEGNDYSALINVNRQRRFMKR